MEKRYNSLAERVQYLEKENKRLNAAIQLLLAEKAQGIQAKELQTQIIHQQLTSSNEKNQRDQEEIQRLRAEIKRLRNEE